MADEPVLEVKTAETSPAAPAPTGLTEAQMAEVRKIAEEMVAPKEKEIANLKRKLARRDQVLELDEEKRQALTDHETVREELLELYAAKGLSRKLLERGNTLADIRAIAADLEEFVPKGIDATSQVVAKAATQLAKTGATGEKVLGPPAGAAGVRGSRSPQEIAQVDTRHLSHSDILKLGEEWDAAMRAVR